MEHGAFGYATERKTAETEQLSSAEMEEKKTFVIRAVVDSDSGLEISLQVHDTVHVCFLQMHQTHPPTYLN